MNNNTLTGNIKYLSNFYSPQLNNYREIIIYLPPDYNKSKENYPVLYMQDGNNIFDASTAFLKKEWNVDETAQILIKKNLIQKIIIIGIYNTYNRKNEYTPFPDKKRGGGLGDKYLKFVTETLKPFIDKNYRTKSDRNNTAIAGSSLGGLISMYAILRYSSIFSKAGILSPTIYWNDKKIIEIIKNTKFSNNIKFWIDMGTNEGIPNTNLEPYFNAINDCREIMEVFENKITSINCINEFKRFNPKIKLIENSGLVNNLKIEYHYEEFYNAKHNEEYWGERFDKVLLYLFPKNNNIF